jgi:2-iminoacetate synthase
MSTGRMISTTTPRIDATSIETTLAAAARPEPAEVRAILDKARTLAGLEPAEVARLTAVEDPGLLEELFAAARHVKDAIYGARLVLFAPLYVSNACCNDCTYCSFRSRNLSLRRTTLDREAIAAEVRALVEQGHRRLLLVSGEALPGGVETVLEAVETVYTVRAGDAAIRRVNVNVAPLSVPDLRRLRGAQIGTYQLFQETYHRPTYARVHRSGPKRDFDRRLGALDRAMEAGLDDVGAGVLFGLHDWRFELLALMEHACHLERRFGVGPHTISVPRIEPAAGASTSMQPPARVSDADFAKLVAILRLAVPYTGLILSTREMPELRRRALALGISQISAGSRTNPGGYAGAAGDGSQFQLGDQRTLDEVIRDVAALGYVPSFCTACYRRGRTGQDFMDLARPGAIRNHCEPNALATFAEYLADQASPETAAVGRALIARRLEQLSGRPRETARRLLDAVEAGDRDALV